MAEKAQLTPDEVYKVAYLYHVMKIEQHALSIAFSVNAGRISEACSVMKYAAEHIKEVYDNLKLLNNHVKE
jgi:hypothetical protein